jgi:single-stranded-DNA-specific exonuclease
MSIKIGNTEIEVPQSELRMRKRNENVYKSMRERGESEITSIIASNRMSDVSQKAYQDLVQPSLRDMEYWKLKSIDVAARRIQEAFTNNEKIGLVTDFDVDGISSAVVMYLALTKYMGFKKENISIHVNNRMKYGYGFTEKALDAVVERSNGDMPTLLITADQGSNDSATAKLYKDMMMENGVDYASVIVTDHHHIDEGETCDEAIAFVNPQRPDDEFDDPTICGCVVALLVMSATRDYMKTTGDLPEDTPMLTPLLTYACLATVADCVSLKSGYNRCIVRRGLRDINNEVIPAWKVLKRKINKPFEQVTATDLGFTLAPAINADSRTGGDGSDAINFLLAETDEEAAYYYEQLKSRNTRRKEVDLSMQESAIYEASKQYFEKSRKALVIYLPEGSHGIHGIVASRVKERFHCPTIIFSPVDRKEKDSPDKIITGSGRCIDNLSIIYMVKDRVGEKVDLTGGGHPAAMGLKIRLGDLPVFQEEFDRVVKEEALAASMDDSDFMPHVMVDHILQEDELAILKDVSILKQVNRLEPYGQRFEAPVFAINGMLVDTRTFGKGINQDAHLNLFFRDSTGVTRQAVVFFYGRQPWINDLAVGEEYTFAVSLQYDAYRDSVGMIVQSVSSGVNAVVRSK